MSTQAEGWDTVTIQRREARRECSVAVLGAALRDSVGIRSTRGTENKTINSYIQQTLYCKKIHLSELLSQLCFAMFT